MNGHKNVVTKNSMSLDFIIGTMTNERLQSSHKSELKLKFSAVIFVRVEVGGDDDSIAEFTAG